MSLASFDVRAIPTAVVQHRQAWMLCSTAAAESVCTGVATHRSIMRAYAGDCKQVFRDLVCVGNLVS